jgi:hypothetical protein
MCGDGPGTATFIDFDGPGVTCTADGSPLCSRQIFEGDCTAYNGSIGIWFGPNIQDIPAFALKAHLSRLGLSGLTHILEDLLLMLPPGPGDAPGLVLSLFEDLAYIGGTLTVDINNNATISPQTSSRRFELLTLHKVSHIGGNLNLLNTRLQDLSIFGALTCVGRAPGYGRSSASALPCSSGECHKDGQIALSGNRELVSYNGLQSLRSVTRSIKDVEGGALMDISPVSRLAHCTDGVEVTTRVRISVAACPGMRLGTWSHVCSYISSQKCPHDSPTQPPPLPPPSPASLPPLFKPPRIPTPHPQPPTVPLPIPPSESPPPPARPPPSPIPVCPLPASDIDDSAGEIT